KDEHDFHNQGHPLILCIKARDFTRVNATTLKTDITSQVNFNNMVKSGMEIVYNDLDFDYGVIASATQGKTYSNRVQMRVFPVRAAFYLQDKLETQGFAMNAGLRLDYSDSRTNWWAIDPYDLYFFSSKYDESRDYTREKSSPLWQLSPRLGISHPITENSKLFFNYGHFKQMPQYETLFRVDRSPDRELYRIGELQCQFSDRGTEVEGEGYGNNTNFFSWPSQYGVVDQTTTRQKSMWIRAKNFYDPTEGKEKSVKVVGIGPRENPERLNMIFAQSVKVIGKYPYPTVVVDDNIASDLAIYEQLDEFDENLPCDRMIIIRINTSIGVSVSKKIMAFSRPDHSNYFINDITFKNAGIYRGSTGSRVHESGFSAL
ncbi:TonB-dependent receptor, partial [candidate division KSB1 bacterium]|nr:TonB-dependent receptor [candidate division KSB1 bacterium]